ncbi:MAG: 16S rRNA (cytidine(1402)-2'-O)-methyltransferase [Erysipelotrichaceae bacterium]|nr:16S rRNA (cytidine(1402)-2'-O)-methyltransferase [Erysipelotrichaceae bacterium]MDD6093055.1 16S rRNA (cytidine(1402)-2'-O)-methyltransferase [bacterium]MDY3934157.1 16S rRNA (cytidine(1402)-2'-O)-methyltransferase [Bacilli bacterium]
MWQNSYDGSPSVYIVPTPIGNLGDITNRALETLKNVDVIFSEDTRVTLQLLNYFNIKNKLIHMDDHNEDTVKEKVLEYLKNDKNVAIVTDRGTPIISDPGYKTVKFLKEKGYNVIALPGACAFVPALVMSSISSEHFTFYGFLSSKTSKMYEELENLKDSDYTLVFYEAPHRIIKTLNAMLEVFGDRYISISREISKLHESVFVGKISEVINTFVDIKGEFVIIVSPNNETVSTTMSIIDSVNMYIRSGLNSMEAIKRVAKERKIPKNDVYMEFHRGGK